MKEENNISEKPVKIWKRKNIHLVNESNDIKFHGPLSYRYLRIVGWFFLFLSQLGVILRLANSMNLVNINSVVLEFLTDFNALATPLFLFAAFSQVLTAKNGYRRLLFTYGLGAFGIFVLFLIIYFHFALGLLHSISGDWESAFQGTDALFRAFGDSGAVSLNIFVDLILCTLVTFFINYRPSEHFQGKKIYIFRSFVAVPIIYELASITIKLLSASGLMSMPPLLIPLLTTKPPIAFFIFVVLALFVKNREKYYLKNGKTHEEYQAFLHTNVNKLHFSLSLIYTIIGAAILDIILFVVIIIFRLAPLVDSGADAITEASGPIILNTYEMGFGKCVPMISLIPLLIFFDYTKTHDNKTVDLVIPVAGIALIILLYIEGLFQILSGYIADFMKRLEELSEEEQEQEKSLLNIVKNIFKGKVNR